MSKLRLPGAIPRRTSSAGERRAASTLVMPVPTEPEEAGGAPEAGPPLPPE